MTRNPWLAFAVSRHSGNVNRVAVAVPAAGPTKLLWVRPNQLTVELLPAAVCAERLAN